MSADRRVGEAEWWGRGLEQKRVGGSADRRVGEAEWSGRGLEQKRVGGSADRRVGEAEWSGRGLELREAHVGKASRFASCRSVCLEWRGDRRRNGPEEKRFGVSADRRVGEAGATSLGAYP